MIDNEDSSQYVVPATPPRKHEGGIYSIPVVGTPLGAVRNFYDDMAPTPEDNAAVTVAKQVVQYGSVVVVSAVAATVML